MARYAGGTTELDRFRRMVGETSGNAYLDDDLRAIIARYPLPDAAGEWPTLTSGSVNPVWAATYDLAAAAADVWEEKAMGKSDNFAFTADGATFHKEQQYAHYVANARRWRSLRAVGSHTAIVYPAMPERPAWLGNLAEADD